jgi:hypothetical protein
MSNERREGNGDGKSLNWKREDKDGNTKPITMLSERAQHNVRIPKEPNWVNSAHFTDNGINISEHEGFMYRNLEGIIAFINYISTLNIYRHNNRIYPIIMAITTRNSNGKQFQGDVCNIISSLEAKKDSWFHGKTAFMVKLTQTDAAAFK